MDHGYIKIHRKIWENPVVTKDADHIAVWIWLITHAVYKAKKVDFAGKITTLQAGQLTTGRQIIAEDCQIDRSKVERILKLFKSEQQIEQQTSNKCRLITIKNWNLYQESEQQSEQQVSNKRATSEQQVSTKEESKEYKEYKEYKNNKSIDLLQKASEFENFWKNYPRKDGKLPAKKAWDKLTKKEIEIALSALKFHKNSEQWQTDSGKFVPHASTWLNQKRFNDQIGSSKTNVNLKYQNKPEGCYKLN